MWTLGLVSFVGLSGLIGAALALVVGFRFRRQGRSSLPLIIFPFGCAAVPVILLAVFAAVGAAMSTSDADLYREMWGVSPTVSDDRLLFDDFGRGASREMYLRAEVSGAEREAMLRDVHLEPSRWSLDQFIGRGDARGLSWWLSASPYDTSHCRRARISDADGFRGWTEFRLAECLDGDGAYSTPGERRDLFVIAYGRADAS